MCYLYKIGIEKEVAIFLLKFFTKVLDDFK